MYEMDPKKLQATYDRLLEWYVKEGREGVARTAQEARAAGQVLSSSLLVDARILDEPVTY